MQLTHRVLQCALQSAGVGDKLMLWLCPYEPLHWLHSNTGTRPWSIDHNPRINNSDYDGASRRPQSSYLTEGCQYFLDGDFVVLSDIASTQTHRKCPSREMAVLLKCERCMLCTERQRPLRCSRQGRPHAASPDCCGMALREQQPDSHGAGDSHLQLLQEAPEMAVDSPWASFREYGCWTGFT